MYTLLLKLALPYLQRYLAARAAGYFQERRTRRLNKPLEEIIPADPLPAAISAGERASSSNTLWFTLAGLLLGGAFGAIFYLLMRDSNIHEARA